MQVVCRQGGKSAGRLCRWGERCAGCVLVEVKMLVVCQYGKIVLVVCYQVGKSAGVCRWGEKCAGCVSRGKKCWLCC